MNEYGTNEFFVDKQGNKKQRQKCQVYTRVMGYLRPVSHYNTGKKSEFYTRKYFEEKFTENSKFMRQYSCKGCPS